MRIPSVKTRGKDGRAAKFPLTVQEWGGQYLKKIRGNQY